MARSLLPTALVAVLAVALPATAADGAEDSPADPVTALTGCLPLDLACEVLPAPNPDEGAAYTRTMAENPGSCSAFALNLDQPSNPLELDPDGCVWALLRHTLGWPPMESQIFSALPPSFGTGP